MTPTQTFHSEHIALEGPIPIAVAVVVGCALLWLFAWSLRRELSVLGAPKAILFWLLRTAALCVTIWMLLAPSSIRSERSRTQQSVALIVDVSDSMQTIDPPASTDELRWTLATQNASDDSTIARADRAWAASTLAEKRITAALSALQAQQPERVAIDHAVSANNAIVRILDNVRTMSALMGQSETSSANSDISSQPSEQIGRVIHTLEGSEFRRLDALATSVAKGQDAFPTGWRESLADVAHQLAGVRRRLETLTHSLARQDNATLAAANLASLEVTRQMPRLTRAATFLDSVARDVLAPLTDKIQIQRAAFDGQWIPLATDTSADTSLNDVLQRTATADRSSIDATRKVTPEDADAANSTDPSTAENRIPVTDINAALEQIRRTQQERPLAAVFLLTDAAHNRTGGRDPREVAAELSGTPVYIVPIGNTQRVRDVDLVSISAPGVVMKDDDVVIEATLQAYDCNGESLRVELLQGGAVIQHREIDLDSAAVTQRVRFNTQLEEVGQQRFQLRITPLEGELSEENNFDQFDVNVTRNHISVLLADERPRWEFRYLAQLFRRDAKVDCDELLFHPRMIATGKREQTKACPTSVDEWAAYDVVLLGDLSTEHFPPAAQESLAKFVRERGGTVVLIAGDEAMPQAYVDQPLGELLPVTRVGETERTNPADGYAFHVTKDGKEHDALMIADTGESTQIAWDFISRNAPLSALSAYRLARPTARTLISAPPRLTADSESNPDRNALLCWQPIGRGRIVYLASPETYRLRFLRGDRLHYRFWGQMLRWAIAGDLAVGSQFVDIRTDRPDYRHGDAVQVTVRLHDALEHAVADADITATAIAAADGSRVTIPLQADDSIPGRYLGTFDELPAGIYRVETAGDEVDRLLATTAGTTAQHNEASSSFAVRSPQNREVWDTRSDRTLAQQIAEATGGQVLPPTAVSEVLALTDLEPVLTENTDNLPLWVEWKYLWIVFGCLFCEWSVRKKMGLS